MELTARDTMGDVAERQTLLRTQPLLTLQLLTLVGDLTCLLLRVDNMELVTGGRCSVETEDDSRLSRFNVVDTLVTLVEQSLHAAPGCTGKHDIADMQRTVTHEHG